MLVFPSHKFLRNGQTSLIWCLVLALALRSFIPLGFMPDAHHQEGKYFALTICHGGETEKILVDQDLQKTDGQTKQQPSPQDDHSGGACPFAASSHVALTSPAFLPLRMELAFVTLLLLSSFVLRRQFCCSCGAARAPPLFS